MVVGFISTYAIWAYHLQCCEFESHSDEVYSIQHYVIKFNSDFRRIVCFFRGTQVFSTNKTDRHNIAEILLKVALNTINLNLITYYNEIQVKINLTMMLFIILEF
jgi:hypothetical protein